MNVQKKILIAAFFITLFLFMTILALGSFLDQKREETINSMGAETYNQLTEMQTFMLMSEIYGDSMACLAFKAKLQELDTSVWDLGLKIDKYRVATEEFAKDPFYIQQKKIFNENEVLYLLLLSKIQKHCLYNQQIILFFYRAAKECPKCDDQSFVLTDIKEDLENEIAIFSFDTDLNITSVQLLSTFYNISTYPCIVIGDKSYCGIQDKAFITKTLCTMKKNTSCS